MKNAPCTALVHRLFVKQAEDTLTQQNFNTLMHNMDDVPGTNLATAIYTGAGAGFGGLLGAAGGLGVQGVRRMLQPDDTPEEERPSLARGAAVGGGLGALGGGAYGYGVGSAMAHVPRILLAAMLANVPVKIQPNTP